MKLLENKKSIIPINIKTLLNSSKILSTKLNKTNALNRNQVLVLDEHELALTK